MWLIKFFLYTGSIFLMGECTCDITTRVTNHDEGISITSRISQTECVLFLQSTSEQQVVAAFYELEPDCAGRGPKKGKIEIYDGTAISSPPIINSCINFGYPLSYASRKYGLAIRINPPYKPFKLRVHSIDTNATYLTPEGYIISPRYPGSISKIDTETYPNNLRAVYRIIPPETVSLKLKFDELYIDLIDGTSDVCSDKLVLSFKGKDTEYCGQNKSLPEILFEETDNLDLQFLTNKDTAYTGFKIKYTACFREIQDSNEIEQFHFPMYRLGTKVKCYLGIVVNETKNIIINMTLNGETGRRCTDLLQIFVDDNNVTEKLLPNCTFGTVNTFTVTSSNKLKLFFTFANEAEYIDGSIEREALYTSILQKGTSVPPNPSSVNGVIKDKNTSNDTHFGVVSSTDMSRAQKQKNTLIVASSASAAGIVVAALVIVILLIRIRRKKISNQEKPKKE